MQGNGSQSDGSRGRVWGAGAGAGPVQAARGHTGSGSSAPPYPAALQALQVDDERLVVLLALGDFGERGGSLAQQLLLRQLVNAREGHY